MVEVHEKEFLSCKAPKEACWEGWPAQAHRLRGGEWMWWNVLRFQGVQTMPWEPVKQKMLRWGLSKVGLRGIYDPGDFTKPFDRFPCGSENNGVLIHSPALKTWTSLKENGGEKKRYQRDQNCVCVNIRNQMVARFSKEKRPQSFPLTSVQPVKINVSTSPRKYSLRDSPVHPSAGGCCSS